MLLNCLLCGVEGDENAREFEQGEPLREHLIENHSVVIARAFLCPDISDPNHIWLMGCVEYKAPEPVDSPPCSPTVLSPADTVSPADGSESTDASIPDVSVNLVEVLATLLGTSVTQELNAGGKSASNRKRPQSRADVAEPKRAHLEVDESVQINEDFSLSCSFDPALLFENAEAIASASGFVDGKSRGRDACKSCHQPVTSAGRYRHVLEVHVAKSDMFTCSACDFSHPSSIFETRKHAATMHSAEGASSQSNELKYRTLIQQWMRRCFDDWKSVDVRPEVKCEVGAEEDDSDVEEDFFDSAPRTPAGPCDSSAVDDRTCQLCWEESRYPGRHLAQKHLRKPLYECPVCEGFGSYESCTVVKHMQKVHPEVEDPVPISNLEKYADEIRDLQNRCFPNRPMKLVRPLLGSKPRERHLCHKCNIQVAQSDRQRHVYHRHLQKTRVFECPMCNFASNYDVHRVKWHLKWMHKEEGKDMEPVSHENEYREEIDRLNEECFPGWQHRRKPFWWLEADEAEKRQEQVKAKLLDSPSPDDTASANGGINGSMKIKKELSPEESENGSQDDCGRLNEFACRLCKKEFKPSANFLRHVAKEHLSIPLYQCPICEGVGGQDAYEIRAHILKAHGKTDLQPLSNLETHSGEIQRVYSECFPGRRLKNLPEKPLKREPANSYANARMQQVKTKVKEVKTEGRGRNDEDQRVTCAICQMDMKTEDRQIHVYRHHLKEPRLYECPLCDFSHHACSSDVRAHIKFVHREQPDVLPRANLLEFSERIAEWNDSCFPGWINRRLPASQMEDFNSCRLCGEDVRQTSRHIAEVHLKIPLHQCPLCEYGAAESRLVARHLKNNHTKKDARGLEPIANVVARRADFSAIHDKCFPGRPKRLSNITISDEGRRAKCKCCGSTVSRKKRLCHLLDKHLTVDCIRCTECEFTHTHDDNVIIAHLKDEHGQNNGKVDYRLTQFFTDISAAGRACFPDWEVKRTDLSNYRFMA